MARSVKKPLGGVRGKVGGVIYRYMNGRTFISVHNEKYNISQTKESKNNRSKFGTTIKFSKTVNSISDLKKVWDHSSAPGRSAYTKIFKHNSMSIQSDFVSAVCSITPGGIGCKIESFEFNINDAIVRIKIDRTFGQNLLPPYNAHFVVFLNDPVNPELHSYINFVNTSTLIDAESPDDYQTIIGHFIDSSSDLISKYKKATVFFAITKTDSKPFEWLSSASKEFNIS
jgi:hypothetical protein